MKASVLIIHSRYLSGAASGEKRVVEDESRLLSEGGHHVDTRTPQYEEMDAIRAGLGVVWSKRVRTETARREALDDASWFDSSIFLCEEDQDICRRIRAATWSVWYEAVEYVVHELRHSWKQASDINRRALIEVRERGANKKNRGPLQARVYLPPKTVNAWFGERMIYRRRT